MGSVPDTTLHVVFVKTSDDVLQLKLVEVKRDSYYGVEGISGKQFFTEDKSSHWMNGKTTFVPLDQIQYIVKYDSIEDLEEAVAPYYSKQASVDEAVDTTIS